MDLKEIKDRLEKIEAAADDGDSETAHSKEDDLRDLFIQCVADGSYRGDIKEGAAEILKSSDIEFSRYCS